MVLLSSSHQTVLPLQSRDEVLPSAATATSPRSPWNQVPDNNGYGVPNDALDDGEEEAAFRAGAEAFLRKNAVHEIAIRSLVQELIETHDDTVSSKVIQPYIEDRRRMMDKNIKMKDQQQEDEAQYGLLHTGTGVGHHDENEQEHGVSCKDGVSHRLVQVPGKKRIYPVRDKSLRKKHPKSLSKPHSLSSSKISPFLINEKGPAPGAVSGAIEDQEGNKDQTLFETEEVQGKVTEFLQKRSSLNSHKLGKENRYVMIDHIDGRVSCDDPVLGAVMLRLAKQAISEDRPKEALSFATQAAEWYERSAQGEHSLDLSVCMHVISAIHCSLGEYEEAVSVLERSIAVSDVEKGGMEHALAAFAGYMQLGDTFALLGKGEQTLLAYHAGLDIQIRTLGKLDSRVGRTCRHLAEAYAKVLQFDKATEFCQQALEIHKACNAPASMEEFADRKLMGLICNGKGQHEAALEHLILARDTLHSNSKDMELAAVNVSIGDTYSSLCQFNKAVPVYKKALTLFKVSKGENNVTVAAVYVRLAEVYLKTAKHHEAKNYCQSALRIYGRLGGKHHIEIASGLTEIAIIYETLNEHKEKLFAMQKAIAMLEVAPRQQNTVAGIEAQIGVLHYMHGNYAESRALIGKAVTKLRSSTENNTALVGMLLCQMGLVCLQLSDVQEAIELLEESKRIIGEKYGLTHPDTLFIHGILTGAYHVLGRSEDDGIALLDNGREARSATEHD